MSPTFAEPMAGTDAAPGVPRRPADAATPTSGPTTSAISRSTLMTVRRVLHAHREGWLLEARLAAAARQIAGDVHRQGHTAAQMLVALKQAWAALDEVRRASPLALDTRELLSRLVTLSIKAYYSTSPSPRRVGQESRPGGHARAGIGARAAA